MKPLETIADLAALARQGFTAQDIKEIMASGKSEEPPEDPAKATGQPDPEKEQGKEKEKEPVKTTEPDYKKMFEDLQAEFQTTKKELEKLQDNNSNKNAAGQTMTDQDILNKLIIGGN